MFSSQVALSYPKESVNIHLFMFENLNKILQMLGETAKYQKIKGSIQVLDILVHLIRAVDIWISTLTILLVQLNKHNSSSKTP